MLRTMLGLKAAFVLKTFHTQSSQNAPHYNGLDSTIERLSIRSLSLDSVYRMHTLDLHTQYKVLSFFGQCVTVSQREGSHCSASV